MNKHEVLTNLSGLIESCHEQSKSMGWWNDLHAGKPLKLSDVTSRLTLLILGEWGEMFDAWRSNASDSHLPQYPAWQVELADVVIRSCDMLGAYINDVDSDLQSVDKHVELMIGAHNELASEIGVNASRTTDDIVINILTATYSDMSEKLVTGRMHVIVMGVLHGVMAAELINQLCASPDSDSLYDIVQAKLAYNLMREDHKLENRKQAVGGKRF